MLRSLYTIAAAVVGLRLVAPAIAQDSSSNSQTLTLSYRPLSPTDAASTSLATIEYDPITLKSSLVSWTPPTTDDEDADVSGPLLSVLSPSGSSLVTQAGLSSKISQDINIWLLDGDVFSVSINTIQPPPPTKEAIAQAAKEARLKARGKEVPKKKPQPAKKAKKGKEAVKVSNEEDASPRVKINLHRVDQGVQPLMATRAPPKVDESGREVVTEQVEEKTFLQKYWLIILVGGLFMMTSGAGGGGGKE